MTSIPALFIWESPLGDKHKKKEFFPLVLAIALILCMFPVLVPALGLINSFFTSVNQVLLCCYGAKLDFWNLLT